MRKIFIIVSIEMDSCGILINVVAISSLYPVLSTCRVENDFRVNLWDLMK